MDAAPSPHCTSAVGRGRGEGQHQSASQLSCSDSIYDLVQYTLKAVVDFAIGKSDHALAFVLHESIADRIAFIFVRGTVRFTVDLDDQHCVAAGKISEVRANRMLTDKFAVAKLAVAQLRPQQRFGGCCTGPQHARPIGPPRLACAFWHVSREAPFGVGLPLTLTLSPSKAIGRGNGSVCDRCWPISAERALASERSASVEEVLTAACRSSTQRTSGVTVPAAHEKQSFAMRQ